MTESSTDAGSRGIVRARARPRTFRLGVDYYPSDSERRAHGEYYPGDLGADFAAMAAAGITTVRVFVSWRRLEPEVGQYDAAAEDRLGDVLAAAGESGLKVVVCFFADDRFSEMNDLPWARARDPRSDDYLVQRQISLVQRVAGRHRTDPSVSAWELGNEPFFAGFASATALRVWSFALRDAICEVDSARAIILGVDAETLLLKSGVDARTALEGFEHGVAHVTEAYREHVAAGASAPGVATHLGAFLVRTACTRRLVVADGIGGLASDLPAVGGAAEVRVAAFSAVMNGAVGAFAARWRDVATAAREQSFRDPYEVLAGLNDISGTPKPALAEIGHLARVVAHLDEGRYARVPERAAVIVPADRYGPVPSLAGRNASRSCFRAYAAAKQAHIPIALLNEGDDLAGYSAILIPSAASLTETFCAQLASLVRSGGSVVLSYGGGTPDASLREVFGVEFRGDAGARDSLACRDLHTGLVGGVGSFDAPLAVPHFALLAAEGATVVATDAAGGPLITLNRFGRGTATFAAAPLEWAMARSASPGETEQANALVRAVYGAAARESGASGSVACDSPSAEVALFIGEQDDVLFVLNHSASTITPVVAMGRTVASVADLAGERTAVVDAQAFGVPLSPYGVSVLRLRYA